MTTTTKNFPSNETIRASLVRAAEKAGFDASNVRLIDGILDQTWGDMVGILVTGLEGETLDRAAKFVEAYLRKHAPRRTYDAQTSVSIHGVFNYQRFSNGAKGVHKGEPKPFEAYTMDHGFRMERVECLTGIAISTCYYPCHD